jgi:hypothetical protein
MNYHSLNEVTVKNKYPLPRIDDLFHQLYGVCVFSKINLQTGYANLSKWEFLRSGLNKYTVMSSGSAKGPFYFMYLMNKVFIEYLDKFVMVFIDGILVDSKSEEEQEEHLCLVLQKF